MPLFVQEDVRESLYDECNHWMRALKAKGTPFMGGSSPNLADLAVYGVLSAIRGCRAFQVKASSHFIKFPAFASCVPESDVGWASVVRWPDS
jgi:hypothetical protein